MKKTTKGVALGALGGAVLGYFLSNRSESGASGLRENRDEGYVCECMNCGHELVTQEHCLNKTCPNCGGSMRRKDRPGRGKELRRKTRPRRDRVFRRR